jgi:hypothetical protein
MMTRPGLKLSCSSCSTEVIVVRAARDDVELACSGEPMVTARAAAGIAPDGAVADGVVLGKRYSDEESGLEVMCTRQGRGPLSVGGRELPVKAAKPLPASD